MKTKLPKALKGKLNRYQWEIAMRFRQGESMTALCSEIGIGICTMEYIIQEAMKAMKLP